MNATQRPNQRDKCLCPPTEVSDGLLCGTRAIKEDAFTLGKELMNAESLHPFTYPCLTFGMRYHCIHCENSLSDVVGRSFNDLRDVVFHRRVLGCANNSDGKPFGRFVSTWMGDPSSGKVRWCGLHGVVLAAKGGIGQPKCRITCFVCPSDGGFFASECAGRCQSSREVVAFSLFSLCAAFLAGFDLLRRSGARRSVPGSRGRWRGSCIAGRMMARRRWGMAGGWGFAAFRSWT